MALVRPGSLHVRSAFGRWCKVFETFCEHDTAWVLTGCFSSATSNCNYVSSDCKWILETANHQQKPAMNQNTIKQKTTKTSIKGYWYFKITINQGKCELPRSKNTQATPNHMSSKTLAQTSCRVQKSWPTRAAMESSFWKEGSYSRRIHVLYMKQKPRRKNQLPIKSNKNP